MRSSSRKTPGIERTQTTGTFSRRIGRKGDLTSKVRESLVSIGRVLLYLANEADSMNWAKETRAQLRGMQRDVQSLSDHAAYLSNKITFLLDAMLGVVNLSRTTSSRFSRWWRWCFMPPTLVASIYGMNFKSCRSCNWEFGYPVAIAFMIAAAIGPLAYFRWKKWL